MRVESQWKSFLHLALNSGHEITWELPTSGIVATEVTTSAGFSPSPSMSVGFFPWQPFYSSLQCDPALSPNSTGSWTQTPPELAALQEPSLSFRSPYHFHTSSYACFSSSWLPLPVRCRLPLAFPRGAAIQVSCLAFTVAATATNSQLQLHVISCNCPPLGRASLAFSAQPCCTVTASLTHHCSHQEIWWDT